MNDTGLHSRLTQLADDLAPDADPYAQITGARALHRRRQRTRMGIAASAAAVALVAVGVPTVVGTLSADTGDAAGPSTSSEQLRGPADAVRAGMAWWEADGSVTEPTSGFSCGDFVAGLSGVDSRYEFALADTGAELATRNCAWSTDPRRALPAERRVDVTMQALPDLDGDSLAGWVERDAALDGCAWTTVFSNGTPNALRVCEPDGARVWELTVLDQDQVGAWVVTAVVGEELPARFDLGAMSLATVWGAIARLDEPKGPPPVGDLPEITPLNREVNELVAALDQRGMPVLASGDGWSCPGATAELEERLGIDLTEGGVRLSLPPQPVCWWAAGPAPTSDAEMRATLTLTIGYTSGAETVLPEEALEPGAIGMGGSATTGSDDTCLVVEVTDEASSPTVDACSQGDRTRLSVIVPDGADEGVWTLTVGVPPDAGSDPSVAALALVDVADRLW